MPEHLVNGPRSESFQHGFGRLPDAYKRVLDNKVEEPRPFRKYTAGKPMWHTMPMDEVEDICRVLTHGIEKYDLGYDVNWKKCNNLHDFYSAAMRHIVGWKREGKDPETGLSHLAHAAANSKSYFNISPEPIPVIPTPTNASFSVVFFQISLK